MAIFSKLTAQLPRSQSFEKFMLNNWIYVDKTDLIYDLAINNDAFFLSRPRRFGKSTLVSTFEELFLHGTKPFVDESGKKQESYFKGLKIEKLWNDHQDYKVIHLDFSTFISDITDFLNKNPELKTSDNSFNAEQYVSLFNYHFARTIHAISDQSSINESLSGELIINRFKDLILSCGKNKVVLLIDEYDFPITHFPDILPKEEQEKYVSLVTSFLKSFYALVKTYNSYFRFIFITGITRYKDAALLTLGNTITDISQYPEFGTIAGFTREEIKHYFYDNLVCQAAIYYEKDPKNISDLDVENLLDLLATWYDGYCFDSLGKTHVFSTISILGFFKNSNREEMFSDYWFDLGGIPTILINNAKQLVAHKIINPFSKQNLFIVDKNTFLSPQSLDSMISPVLLFQTGYLTIARSFTNQVYLKFPNLELKRAFNTLQSSYLFNDDNNSLLQSQNGEAVIFNDSSVSLDFNCTVETLKSFFNQILNLIPYNQFSLNDEAAVASSIFLYLKGRDLICEAEAQNCIGRSDLKVYLNSHQVFIFEFKYLPENSAVTATSLLERAQEQILEKRYGAIANTQVRAFALLYSQKEKQLTLMSEVKLVNP